MLATPNISAGTTVTGAATTLTPKLHVVLLANAAAIVVAVGYTICALFGLLAPGAFLWLSQAWFHGLLVNLAGPMIRPETFLIGLITLTAWVWLFVASLGWVYTELVERTA